MITEKDILRDHMSEIVLPRLNEMLFEELCDIQDDLKLSDSMIQDLCYNWLKAKIRIIEFGTFEFSRKKEK